MCARNVCLPLAKRKCVNIQGHVIICQLFDTVSEFIYYYNWSIAYYFFNVPCFIHCRPGFTLLLRMRFQILEDTYQRREVQLKEENDFVVKQFNERLKAVEMEKNEIVAANKERRVVVEKNRDLDIERVKSLHKKVSFM